MNIDILNEAIGGIDAYIVEEALADGEKKPKVTAFAQRPWMKWAAAAVAIVVIAAGTPLALKAIGSFRNENFVAPNGSGNGNPGAVAPVDSGEPESSSEPDSSSAPESENNASSEQSGESRSRGSEQQTPPASDPPETSSPEPDSSSFDIEVGSGSIGGPLSIGGSHFGGNFHKKNMPAVTYRINGESQSFDYDHSAWIMIDAESDLDGNEGVYIIDYYSGKDGSSAVAYDGSEELMEYTGRYNDYGSGDEISEVAATEAAKNVLLNTDLPFAALENLQISKSESGKNYHRIVASFTGGEVEILLNKDGSLKHFIVNRDASVWLTPERIAAGREKLDAKIDALSAERPNERFVATGVEVYQKLANKIYAIYEVIQYPYQGSDFQKRLRFYCVV
ncbi:MAG: hypothetical protein J5441_07780 [Clostridia bacterium]|nr:hypothetical protein [Clostridia bacterium]